MTNKLDAIVAQLEQSKIVNIRCAQSDGWNDALNAAIAIVREELSRDINSVNETARMWAETEALRKSQ